MDSAKKEKAKKLVDLLLTKETRVKRQFNGGFRNRFGFDGGFGGGFGGQGGFGQGGFGGGSRFRPQTQSNINNNNVVGGGVNSNINNNNVGGAGFGGNFIITFLFRF